MQQHRRYPIPHLRSKKENIYKGSSSSTIINVNTGLAIGAARGWFWMARVAQGDGVGRMGVVLGVG